MNDNYLFENLVDDCDQLIEILNDECIKLNQELQEMYVSSEFPEANSSLITMNQNTSSNTFDPIAISNGLPENTSIGSERILNENEIINILLNNFNENTYHGNVFNDIDGDVLNQYLLSIQEKPLVNTNEISMDDSMKSFLEEIKSHPVSLLETTFNPEKDGNLRSCSMVSLDQIKELSPIRNNFNPKTINNIVSKT